MEVVRMIENDKSYLYLIKHDEELQFIAYSDDTNAQVKDSSILTMTLY